MLHYVLIFLDINSLWCLLRQYIVANKLKLTWNEISLFLVPKFHVIVHIISGSSDEIADFFRWRGMQDFSNHLVHLNPYLQDHLHLTIIQSTTDAQNKSCPCMFNNLLRYCMEEKISCRCDFKNLFQWHLFTRFRETVATI